jgi:small subunit ribosomal protein S9
MADEKQYYYGMGRRKEAVATARLYAGKGDSTVNDHRAEEYFNNEAYLSVIAQPLKETGNEEKFYASIKVKGGGKSGQADAARLAVAKALITMNQDLRPTLKKAGMLTRDSREKERKKPGLKRARKAPQFSKR